MAKFFGLEDLAIAKTLLQQLRTKLNSSESKRSFFCDKGSKLIFRALTTTLSTLSTHIEVVVKNIKITFANIPPLFKNRGFLGGRSVIKTSFY